MPSAQSIKNPYTSLITIFVASKILLFSLAFISPGIGYDTSTALLLRLPYASDPTATMTSPAFTWPEFFTLKLVRWDAIYFVSVARRGYLFEQEWAFGWGYAKLVTLVSKFLDLPLLPVVKEAFAGVLVATTCHLLSALVLYRLIDRLITGTKVSAHVPFVAACLHIFAPGGLFLVAPYSESLFALINFCGNLAYCESKRFHGQSGVHNDLLLILAGAIFGLGATVRSNALSNGLFFAYDAVMYLKQMPQGLTNLASLRYGISIGLGGSLILVGFAGPQYIAYSEFCTGGIGPIYDYPLWCNRVPPSIYTFVQKRYWDVGFLRYWTKGHIPLFAMAIPMLIVLWYSGKAMYREPGPSPASSTMNGKLSNGTAKSQTKSPPRKTKPNAPASGPQLMRLLANEPMANCLRRMASPTLVLVPLAIFQFHVQIITRLASAYPTPYLWLAMKIVDEGQSTGPKPRASAAQATVRFMIMYAIIQGGLFSSFIQPA